LCFVRTDIRALAGGGGGGYGGGGAGLTTDPADGGGGGGGSTGPSGRSFSVATNAGAIGAAGGNGYVYITPSDNQVSSEPSPLPPDVFQSVGLPQSGACASIDDSALNWGGSSSGGWTPSWAQWMNDGHGGAVCNRVLGYDTYLEHWITR
jgi:hypothetical protein